MSHRFLVRATWVASLFVAAGTAQAGTVSLSSQSPIDITSANTTYATLPAFDFSYGSSASLDVANTGSPSEEASIKATVQAGSSLTLAGTTYNLLQFHFHAPAEHEINGAAAPMELHLVHSDANGNLLVVGRFIEACPGACTSPLDGIFSALPASGAAPHLSVSSFDLNALLPSDLSSFRYSGSLTTHPFTEPVAWNVLAAPLFMSQSNIDAFTALFDGAHGNSREVQDLNGRTILTDVAGFANPVPEPATYGLMAAGLLLVGLRTRRQAR